MSFLSPDIPTIYLMTGFSSVAAAAILLALRGDHKGIDRSMPIFAAGILAMGLGFLFFALRTEPSTTVAVTLGYTAFGIAALLVWLGTTHLFGRPASPWPGVALALAYVATMAWLHEAKAEQALWRITLSSGFSLVCLGLSAHETRRSLLVRSLRSARLLHALLVAYCAVIALRLTLFVVAGIPLNAQGISGPGLARTLTAVVFGSLPFALTVSVLSIANGQLSSRLRKLAITDELTGLVSRRSLQESGPRLLERSGECIALLMLDLDNFKAVNDRHGHLAGDEMLRHIAALLRRSLRPDSLIVRYGGDEFCALVPVSSEGAAFGVAERLRATIEASPYHHGDLSLPITMSVGVSVHRPGRTLREMLDEADGRAYRAKAQGRNRVVADDAIVMA
ncbi:MAG: GGDEF domain-containing protein [Burkholderiaceae bacterium]|jgi:diguanylate cyclase (GGDEF)-like protein|nr:GGDEF domain-containing protein [Burkholderiaceae bacterium]